MNVGARLQSALRRIENEEKDLRSRLAVLHLELSENDDKIKNLRDSIYEISDRIAAAGSEKESEATELAAAIEPLENSPKSRRRYQRRACRIEPSSSRSSQPSS